MWQAVLPGYWRQWRVIKQWKNPCGLEWLWNCRVVYRHLGWNGIASAWFSGNMLCLPICLEVTADSGLEFCHRFHLRIVQRRWKYTWGSGPCYPQNWNDRKIRWVSEKGRFKMEWCNTGKVPKIISFCDFFTASQDCVRIENMETLVLQAPKDSFAQKSSERGIGQAAHRFTFSQVWKYLLVYE